MVEHIVEPAVQVMRQAVLPVLCAVADARLRITARVQPVEIMPLPLEIDAAGDRQRRKQPRALVRLRPRLVFPVQMLEEIVQQRRIAIGQHGRERIQRTRIEQLQCGGHMRRRVERMMRVLVEQAGLGILHVLHRLDPAGALLRVALKAADGIENVGRIGAAILVHAHLAAPRCVLPQIAAVRALGQPVRLHCAFNFCNDRISVQSIRLPMLFSEL